MAQQHASKQPRGFKNHIEKVAIVGVSKAFRSRYELAGKTGRPLAGPLGFISPPSLAPVLSFFQTVHTIRRRKLTAQSSRHRLVLAGGLPTMPSSRCLSMTMDEHFHLREANMLSLAAPLVNTLPSPFLKRANIP